MSWVVEQQELHITAGLMPQFKSEDAGTGTVFDLQNELQMTKAALLYGDHAKLCSFAPAALFNIAAMTDVPQGKRLEFLQEAATWQTTTQTQREAIEAMVLEYQHAKSRRYSRRGERMLKELDERLDRNWGLAKQKMETIILEEGGQGIVDAVSAGLLDVHTFRSFLKRREGLNAKEFITEYVEVLSAAVSDFHTYALFDELTSNLISSRIADGTLPVSGSGIDRSKEVALAADLLARLPLFPYATVKEILEIRRELEIPLRSFRAAMISFSETIKNAAWDDDFSADAEQVFRRDVEPAIINLEEEEKSNTFLREFGAKLADKSIQVGGAVSASTSISALAVTMFNLPLTDVAALAIFPAAAVGGVAYSAYTEWKRKQKELNQNNLFFYYKAGNLLEEGRFQYQR